MEWLDRMNYALDYIEDNLVQDIDYKKIAQAACCSEYHFSRMFSSIAGIPLSEYIRRRRLTLAAFEIQQSESRIIDIAMKYGYSSADSFSRAFQKMHGVKPSAIRKKSIPLKAYPRITFQITIKGDSEMDYRIENVEFDLRIVGRSNTIKTSRAFKTIPSLWNASKKNGFTKKLIDMSWENPKCTLEGLLGICGKEAAITEEKFNYFMGVRYNEEPPTEMETLIIPASLWVVFPNIVDAWKRLYTEWVPNSGYELANLPCIECYYGPKHKPRHELWVPILAKPPKN
ncbi:MAG: AraC family transcriptional regulator [Bacillota bacterium]|uniref:AraC family transcriptional regulator n=1 Tax=Virgibacillus TaxID=84406 RepID=UPI000EF4A3AC|nr:MULTISPECIES: AraC family transcriptional regulator [Virgibacillus]MCC2249708.1 AraC family transcriptional regulator [Virgibacillus sp. AGTR]MDY7042699.1 AraC family transcriptional regulator [Virgibacillus sp. M23]QRZ17153.1 AraC family transcriptional regulator [Virgibacillus sp. AGTR]WBX79393.1 AraC family transcriptional regulator [Virgibacillus salarius]